MSVDPDGLEETFDIEVPGPANFVVGDVVTHNSGAIENDADVILLLHREGYYMDPARAKAEGKDTECMIIVAKNRYGPVGEIRMGFQRQYALFHEL